jgi:hypothetical protein
MKTNTVAVFATAVTIIALIGCGPPPRQADDDGDDTVQPDGSEATPGCAAGADAVYAFDTSNHLSVFDPTTKTFTDLGALSCPTHGSTSNPTPGPWSMGVDRNTMAWMLYDDGELFTVDINHNLNCTATAWHPQTSGELAGLVTFGMGFSTDTPGGTTDTLFVVGGTPGGAPPNLFKYNFVKLDTASMTATKIAEEAMGRAEMTGNSNAELWGFFADGAVPHVVQFDKTNGSFIKDFPEPSLATASMSGFAFAHWGGDYWVFLYQQGVSTTVYQIDGMTGAVKSTTPNTGRSVVGAGVSTCAPVVIL